jgi:hypothetical protein
LFFDLPHEIKAITKRTITGKTIMSLMIAFIPEFFLVFMAILLK